MSGIIQFICCNIDREGLRPLHAANEFKCSSRTIHRTCADNGTTFSKLLMEIRLSVAAWRLCMEEERISEVAYSSGFASLPHFCRLFKARFGLAPSEYRRNLRRDLAGAIVLRRRVSDNDTARPSLGGAGPENVQPRTVCPFFTTVTWRSRT
nr:helix-turn-helix transcriptional regulator [Bradyrhizobium sp. UFLA03-84]